MDDHKDEVRKRGGQLKDDLRQAAQEKLKQMGRS